MNTTGLVMTVTDELLAELEAAADVFPDYEWDSNTEPFFNGPSGESLGGGSTGFYCVYGQPFEIDDETYDGPTLVEACPLEQAKFICEAKPTIKMLTAELRRLRAENAELAKDAGRYRWITAQGFATIRPGDDKITLFTIASQHVDADTLDTAIDTAMATQ